MYVLLLLLINPLYVSVTFSIPAKSAKPSKQITTSSTRHRTTLRFFQRERDTGILSDDATPGTVNIHMARLASCRPRQNTCHVLTCEHCTMVHEYGAAIVENDDSEDSIHYVTYYDGC